MSIAAPPAETAWIMTRVLGFDAMEEADLAAVLETATAFAEGELAPLDRAADRAGAHLKDGRVVLPPGFHEAFQAYAEGGWVGVAAPAEHGGMGLAEAVALAAFEPVSSASMAFGLCPLLTQDAILLLEEHGTADQKARLLAPLVSGRWTGTMCLTEPQAGSDLGLLRTRAEPDGDGFRISGQKIFITYGEHEMTENILHMVLARLPGAPEGTGGISLFAVPRFLADGTRNAVRALSLEEKLGIHASPTCVMEFAGAAGELVGAPHRGLPAMFAMMNGARLGVATQGVAIAERAFRRASDFAAQRAQGGGPILAHPDVRRMLLTSRAYIEGCRALAGWVARELEILEKSDDGDAKQAADDFASLMTPVVKAMFTDLGFEIASLAVQTYGGHGYIRDHGIEQYVRDARIAMLYEGTNGIQALDLVGRKLPQDGGRLLTRFLDPVLEFIDAHQDNDALAEFLPALSQALEHVQEATGLIMEGAMTNRDEVGAASVDYLRLFGLASLAFVWARMVAVAAPKAGEDGEAAQFYRAKVQTAKFFMERLLPQTGALLAAIRSGAATMMEFEDAAF